MLGINNRFAIIVILYLFFISCATKLPDLIKQDGTRYKIKHKCLRSQQFTSYGYHYGFNVMNARFEYFFGPYTETICLESKYDTLKYRRKY
jgi:hypothetical protein